MTDPMRFDLVGLQPQFNGDLSVVRLQLRGSSGERVDADLKPEELLPLIEALMRFEADLAVRRAPAWNLSTGEPAPPQLGRPGPPVERVDFFADVDLVATNEHGLATIDFRATDGSMIRVIVSAEGTHLLATSLAAPIQSRPT